MKTNFLILCNFIAVTLGPAQGYYPLEIGNRWDYGYLDSPRHYVYQRTTSIVGDTLMRNDKRYAILNEGNSNSYLRQEGDSVYTYSDAQGETVLYDFSRQDGDTITAYYRSDTLVTVVYRGERDVFGQPRTAWTFETRSLNTSFYNLVTIADSIGYIYSLVEPGVSEYCLGVIINGIQYGTITGVHSSPSPLPSGFGLAQNYPNPFNPTTTISYTVPKRTYLTLTVYTIMGQAVQILKTGWHEPGSYQVQFDGNGLSNGLYFYRLQSDHTSQTKTMVLLQ